MRWPTFISLLVMAAATTGQADEVTAINPTQTSAWSGHVAPIAGGAVILPRRDEPSTLQVRPDVLTQAQSVLGDRRAAVTVESEQEKTVLIPAARRAEDTRASESSPHGWSGRRASWQPGGAGDLQPGLVERYQSKLRDAAKAADRRAELVVNQAGFAGLNRFIFRRNRPDESVPVSGPGRAPERP